MIQSTTLLCETAIVAGSVAATAKTAVRYETDEKGNKTAIIVDKKKSAIGTTICTAATTATYGFQQQSLNNTLQNVHNAQAYIESLSDEKLAELSELLDEKQLDFEMVESSELEETNQQYTKK